MKKFIITATLFTTSLIVGDFIIGGLSDAFEKYTLKNRPEAFHVKIPYIVNKVDADVLIWGASTASHNYISQEIEDSLKMSTYNCGHDGTYIYFQTALLDLLLERYTPKLIVWEIAPNCLSNTISEELEFSNLKWLYPYYNRNPKCQNVIDLQNHYNFIKLKSKSYSRNSYFQSYLHCFMTKSCYYPTGYAPIHYDGIPYPHKEASVGADDIVVTKEKCLKEALRTLKNRNVKVVFTLCPIYRDDKVLQGESFKRLEQLAYNYNVDIINSYSIEPFSSDSTYFRDPDHMYENGSEKYMKHFIPKLKMLMNR